MGPLTVSCGSTCHYLAGGNHTMGTRHDTLLDRVAANPSPRLLATVDGVACEMRDTICQKATKTA